MARYPVVTCHHICWLVSEMNLRKRAVPRFSLAGLPFITHKVAPPMIEVAFLYGAPQNGSWPVPHLKVAPLVNPPISAEDCMYMPHSPLRNLGSAAPCRPP